MEKELAIYKATHTYLPMQQFLCSLRKDSEPRNQLPTQPPAASKTHSVPV